MVKKKHLSSYSDLPLPQHRQYVAHPIPLLSALDTFPPFPLAAVASGREAADVSSGLSVLTVLSLHPDQQNKRATSGG
jgi:hypothetical protein